MEELMSEYIKELKAFGHRERGITGLKSRVKRFLSYLCEKGISVNQVRVKEAQEYQGWLKEQGKAKGLNLRNATLKVYITACVNFYEFLKTKHIVYTNPFKEIRRARVEKVLPRNLPKEKDMNIFLNKLSRFEEETRLTARITRFKVYVAAELLYATGLRIAEAANLKLNDIDFKRGIVNVTEGKQGLSRICFLNEYAKKLLKIYIEEFRELTFNYWNKTNRELLFGVKWSSFEKTVNKVLKKTAAGLHYDKFTSHCFRHCLGYHLFRAGCDIRHIQAILGHKLLRNTEVYTKVDKEKLKEVFERCHPRTLRRKDSNERINKKSLAGII